jgi:hypothetical protein
MINPSRKMSRQAAKLIINGVSGSMGRKWNYLTVCPKFVMLSRGGSSPQKGDVCQ